MPRSRRAAAEPEVDEGAPLVLRAAGTRLPGRAALSKASRSGRAWQDRCWEFYDTIGEYRYGCDWVGSMLSKATLYVAENGRRVTVGAAVDYLNSLFGGPDEQPQMLRETGIHLTVAGELYLVGTTVDDVERWFVVASTEISTRGGHYYISGKQVKSDEEPFVMRLHRPHPRRGREANSPSRAILPILAELDVLTKRIFAEIDSRLAGAGILFVPSSLNLPGAVTVTGGDAVVGSSGPGAVADRVQSALQEAMMTAVGDQSDASALVPIVISADVDTTQNVKLQTFWSDLDAVSIELRTEAIRRLALGLDMPPEVLTGTADMTHWNAWALEESGIKAHIEPILGLITESLTEGFLQPLLIDDGMSADEARSFTIEADTSELRLRPNRSKEAFDLFNLGELSPEALLREVGFHQDDSPTQAQVASWLTKKVSQGQTTPEIVEAALRLMGVDIEAPVPVVGGTTQARPVPATTAPQVGPPQRTTTGPDQDGHPPAGEELLAAAEVLVFRALERAGNRLRNRIGRKVEGVCAADTYLHVPVTAGMLDHLLQDAFMDVSRFAACGGVDPEKLTAALDAYCRQLLTTRAPVDVQTLASYVEVARDATRAQRVAWPVGAVAS